MQSKKKGIMTISLLILLSSILLISMLFIDDIVRLHSVIVSQRKIYLQRDFILQELARNKPQSLCNNLALELKESAVKIPLQLENENDVAQHYVWCKRYALFLQAPRVGVNEGQFADFINRKNIARFTPRFQLPPQVLPKDKGSYLYWFDKNQTEWELTGNIYAVVVAEGDLHISGKGKISGAVITAGHLTKDSGITLAYRRATVSEIVQSYSQWELGEKSWNDFKP